ncbi:MAG: triple tyrosine motif-containing protein [Verrucomicrobia bacterium]|nr:triple tyrosine motif-containing protein [Verrucomicrobiota bacterium]
MPVHLKSPLPWRWLASLMMAMAAAAPVPEASPPWAARVWQSDEGLPDNTVVGIEQMPDGFLLVATQTGLVRFDGLQFRHFTPATTAVGAADLIQALLVDRRNRLWIAKERGTVVCVDQGRATTVLAPAKERSNRVTRMLLEDATGAVWVSYLGGVVLRIEDGRARTFTEQDGLPGGSTCQLTLDRDGQLWFSQGEWLGVLREGKFRLLEQVTPQRISGARGGGIWACNGNRLFKYREGGEIVEVARLPRTEPEISPTLLCEDRAGYVWVGTRGTDLFRVDGKSGSFERVPAQQEILSFKEDREGNLWVGTRGGGLAQLKPRFAELLSIDPAFPLGGVRSVCQDRSGTLWAVGQNGWVSRNPGPGWQTLSTQDGWSVSYAQCVAADPRGGVWIGTQYQGLHRWLNGALTTSLGTAQGLAANCVSALLASPSGELWIGARWPDAQRHALQCRQAERLRTFELPAASGVITALALDVAGDCWAATASGLLLRVHADVLIDETPHTLAEPRPIRSLCARPDGSLWIGYGGEGLGRLKDGRFSHCRMEQGLHDDYLSNIIPDDRGRLWFAGNRGIFSVRESEVVELAEERIARVRSVAYGQMEGLSRLQASHGTWPGTLRGSDGRLWFAMESGLAVVNVPDFKDNPQAPPVVLERVTANGKIVATYAAEGSLADLPLATPLDLRQEAAHLRLAPGQRQVEFVFTALSFTMPESINFKYRLDGLDKDWVDAGTRRVASYPLLPPGDYRFQVCACNRDGVWNETGASLALTAEAYWWERTWFRVLGPLAAIGLLGGGIALGVRRRHRRQIEHLELLQATERERTRIAQDLHDDLGAGLTQISLNTAMAQNPAVSSEVADGLLHEIDERSRDLVIALDEIVWAVNPKNDSVPSLARYFCQFAQHCLLSGGITCRLEVAADLPDAAVGSEQRHHLFLAFKEALRNILQHSGADQAKLEIASDAQTFAVTLSDNGRGFVPGPLPEGADGLGNMRTRLARLGGSCVVTSEPDHGTTIVFRLPLAAGSGSG